MELSLWIFYYNYLVWVGWKDCIVYTPRKNKWLGSSNERVLLVGGLELNVMVNVINISKQYVMGSSPTIKLFKNSNKINYYPSFLVPINIILLLCSTNFKEEHHFKLSYPLAEVYWEISNIILDIKYWLNLFALWSFCPCA